MKHDETIWISSGSCGVGSCADSSGWIALTKKREIGGFWHILKSSKYHKLHAYYNHVISYYIILLLLLCIKHTSQIYGYGSIPINTIFSGMNIHKSQLFSCEQKGYQGFDPLPYIMILWGYIMLYTIQYTGILSNT